MGLFKYCVLVVVALAGYPANMALAGVERHCRNLPPVVKVDLAWAGARVDFDALETNGFIYVGYYDDERWLAVSQIDKCTGAIKKVRLPSRFGGWDSHNAIVLALDQQGRLHVTGNMHVSSLVYARMDHPDDLSGLTSLRPMVGKDEKRVTYPAFFRFPVGELGFTYRHGHSGDGREIVNRFNGESWERWLDDPLFAPEAGGRKVNAYHTGIVAGPDGYFHVAWVWRQTPDVETNFHVNYARTRDLKHWQNSRGEPVALPITPANAEVVDPVPQGNGLFNNIRLGFDHLGRPAISYLKFDPLGYSQLMHARREQGGWRISQATNWRYRWDPRGRGSIAREITFSGLAAEGERARERVSQPEIGEAWFQYEARTLAVTAVVPVRSNGPAGFVGGVLNAKALQPGWGRGTPSAYQLKWTTYPEDNRDKPRDCAVANPPCPTLSALVLESGPDVSGKGK